MQHSPSVLWKVFFSPYSPTPQLCHVMCFANLVYTSDTERKRKKKKRVTDSLMTLIMFLYPDTMFYSG